MDVENLAAGVEAFTGNVWNFDATLVDVGEGEAVLERIRDRDVETVVVTHSHHDHVDNLPAVVEAHDPEVHAFEPGNLPVDAEPLADGDELVLGGVAFEVLHTPGHKDDSICLHAPAERVLFSGDLVFPGGAFGRTDLEEGDRDRLIKSLERVAELDVEELYAGHGEAVREHADEGIAGSLTAAKRREPKYD